MDKSSKMKSGKVTGIMHALADPTRQKVVTILSDEGKQSATALYERFDVSHPAISQHLRVLKEAEVVNVEKKGQYRFYSINKTKIREIEDWTSNIRKMWERQFETLEKFLEIQKAQIDKNEMKIKMDETRDVEIVWVFDAPVEIVWKAFTDPEMEVKWARCIVPVGSIGTEFLEHDLRVGGRYLIKSVPPWSKEQFFNTGFYRKIEPLNKLVYTESFSDKNGNIISGRQIGLGYEIPLEREVEISFENFEDGTRIRLIHRGLPANGHSDKAATEIGKSLVQLSNMIENPLA